MNFSNRSKLFLLLLIVIVCLPRFDRNDFLIQDMVGSGMGNDSSQYVAMADGFKGETPRITPTAPFTYRALVPYLASFLPLPSMTAINVINVLTLWLGTNLLAQLLVQQGMKQAHALLVMVAFIVSFPVFYYGAIGYLDTTFIGLLAIGSYLLARNQDGPLIAVIFISTFVKESIVLIVPVYFLQGLVQKRGILRIVLTTAALVASYMFGMWLARKFSSDQSGFTWEPSMETFLKNVYRVRTWLSFLLSAGLLCALGLLLIAVTLLRKNLDLFCRMLPWIAGIGGSMALFFYSLVSAYSDGRFIWPATVFVIPLLGLYYNEYKVQISRGIDSKLRRSRLAIPRIQRHPL